MSNVIKYTLAGVVYVTVVLTALSWLFRFLYWNMDMVQRVWP